MTASSGEGVASATQSFPAQWKLVEAALAGASLEALATAAEMDVSQASKVRSGQLGAKAKEIVKMLHAAGLKVVPADSVCVDAATYQAVATIATRAMADSAIATKLLLERQG